jgi:hypothetical protein
METKAICDNPHHSDGVPRGCKAIRCACGGFAESVDVTHEEAMTYDCGRYQRAYHLGVNPDPASTCCAVAYRCVLCGQRYAGEQDAPEMD